MHQTVDPEPPDHDGIDEEIERGDQQFQMMFDIGHEDRAMLRTIRSILEMRSHEADPSPRVQFAYDQLHISACERAGRILRSDLPPSEENI